MSRMRMSGVVLAVLLLAGCGGEDGSKAGAGEQSTAPASPSSSPSPTPTPTLTPTPALTPTPTPTPRRTPTPAAPAADCTGTFKNGMFTLSGRNIFISGSSFSCADGQVIEYERLKTSVRFSYGSKHVTLGPKKSASLAGYRLRVGLSNSKQATFTVDRLTSS